MQRDLLPRRRCIICYQPRAYIDEPHTGPCGRPCAGGEPIPCGPEGDAVVARSHRHGGPCCEVPHAP